MATKLTYSEQLKHPKWQKVRLEKLESANFECENCGANEITLHVHHKQYFKGRMAWEYTHDELSVLCEVCHELEHHQEEIIKRIIASSSSHFSFLAGMNLQNDSLDLSDLDDGFDNNPHEFMAGAIAYLVTHLRLEQMYEVAQFAVSLSRELSEARLVFEHNKYLKQVGALNG
jgi:ribosomal protein S27AE